MTPKLCKYLCGTMLEGFDEENRKFLEAGTRGLHTKERCQEAKAKLEQKNDHGNETYSPRVEGKILEQGNETTTLKSFVDHTLKGLSKCKIFSYDSKADTEIEYNKFLAENKDRIKTQGAHDHVTNQGEQEPLRFTIYLYYEESK